MILSIVPVLTEEIAKNGPANVKYIDYRTFNDIHIHPFISTNTWECIEVTVAKGIVPGYIKQVLTRVNNVVARIPKDTEFNFTIISLLMEIYPSIGNELRKRFMGRIDSMDILKEAGAIFE